VQQTFVLHTQKSVTFVLGTQKACQKAGPKKLSKSWQKKAAKKFIPEPVLLLS